ncbi:hypothetical protein UA08_07880 [Talaromyces atroroseus]|uniref:RRM domain-containing protein n=1 Tax=Talaromyces atroroseus TaxID=1441469 RepID=A0A225A9M3_TALAT|nr:hypothetical protein UA08_07880 [Talaromyces atroroseus]OKL56750.1 hypothetical protein UA08_07880 [Talaromyces atroroseus]
MLSERRAISNSPHSPEGAAANLNTPDTKVTVYSPEDLRAPLFARAQKDPRQSFEGMAGFSVSNFNFQRFGFDVGKPGIPNESPVRTVSYAGLPTPNTDSRSNKLHFSESAFLASPFSGARASLGLSKGNPELPYFPPKSRAFVVEGVSPALSHLAVASLFTRREFESIQGPYLSALNSLGKFIVSFTDLRDTQRALEKIQVTHPEWRVIPLSAREYAQDSMGTTTVEGISDFEGQVSIKVSLRGGYQDETEFSQMSSLVQGLVKSFGAVNAFKATSSLTTNAKEFLVEFCDTTDSANTVAALNGACIEEIELGVKHVRPDLESTSGSLLQQLMNTRDNMSPSTTSPFQFSGCTRDHSFVLSPTGRSTVPMDDLSDIMGFLSPAQKVSRIDALPQHADSRFADQRPKHPQNVVNVDRIRMGLDVRTTIMLRNIPNKVDLPLLKNIVDETSFGKYDFMYLRIDFANNCNVGYAFINFEDPIDIIDFVEARAGRTCDKVAEVSYARPLAGTEEPFPGPNNMSKMRRSVENAEQVGLFAPRMSRDVRRGHGAIRPEQQQIPTTSTNTAAAAFLRNAASPPQRQGQSQGQVLSNFTPMTSPVTQRRGPL